MSMPNRHVRACLAGLIAYGLVLLLPFPGWLFPTLAVVTFVALCFLFSCLSIVATAIFIALVALTPVLLFTAGLSAHTAVVSALAQSIEGFSSQPALLVWFLVSPPIAAAVLHLGLRAFTRGADGAS